MKNLIKKISCRSCNKTNFFKLIDFGLMPIANNFISPNQIHKNQKKYPLKIIVCKNCFLVQTQDYILPKNIFHNDYAFFSQYSKIWVNHVINYKKKIYNLFLKNNKKNVICEIASNDGILLEQFKNKNNYIYGIEPTKSTAEVAKKKGLKIFNEFFNYKLAKKLSKKGLSCDLIIANNVIAHIPDVNDFLLGMNVLLKKNGVITIEFQYLVNLIEKLQFDTLYHEHFSYFSLTSLNYVVKKSGLKIFHCEEIDTHGGSLRVYIKKLDNNLIKEKNSVKYFTDYEFEKGIKNKKYYQNFEKKIRKIKVKSLNFINNLNDRIIAFGASAKGTTFINYIGLNNKHINFVVDKNPNKSGKYLPGSKIPIISPNEIIKRKNVFALILSWNLKKEILLEYKSLKKTGTKFFICIPKLRIY